MTKLRMGELYQIMQLAETGLHLSDILVLMDVPTADTEALIADPTVQHAFHSGVCRGLQAITSAVHQQAVRGNTSAARVVLQRAVSAGDAIDAEEAKPHRRPVTVAVDVISSIDAALARQKALLEGMTDDGE